MAKINTKILRVETSVAKPVELQIFHGEQVDLELHFVAYGRPVDLQHPESAGTGFYWQTEDMGDRWWYEEGISHFPYNEAKREQGIVDFVWDSGLDTGAAKYRWFVNVNRDDPADSSYRAFGTIEMLGSPANASITPLPVPPIPIDCSDYTWLNAPWIPNTSGSVSAVNIGFNSYDVPFDNDDTNGTVGEKLDALDDGKLPGQYDDETDSWEVPNIVCNGDAYIDVLTTDTVRAISLGLLGGEEVMDIPDESGTIATREYVAEQITQGTAIYRGSFATKAALNAVQWQTSDPEEPNFVSNNDYAVVLADESRDGGCWRYIYVIDTAQSISRWEAQYEISESPLTQAQLDALNSTATKAKIDAIANKLDKSGGTMTGPVYLDYNLLGFGTLNDVYVAAGNDLDEVVFTNPNNGNQLLLKIGDGGTVAKTSDIPSVPVSSVNGRTGDVVLSAESVSALPATPYTQGGYTNTWQLPANASIVPNNMTGNLWLKATNIVVPSIQSSDTGNSLLVPNGAAGGDWIARRSDIPAVSGEVWSFTLQGGTTITKSVAVY